MIAPGPTTRVFLALGATDMRKGFDGLFGLVQSKLEADPLSGHLFVFANAARNRLKVFYWDGRQGSIQSAPLRVDSKCTTRDGQFVSLIGLVLASSGWLRGSRQAASVPPRGRVFGEPWFPGRS